MSLLDDLRAAAPALDQQFQPQGNETGAVLGALVAYVEHGDKFLEAAGQEEGATQAVTGLMAPPATDEAGDGKKSAGSSSGASGSSSSSGDKDKDKGK